MENLFSLDDMYLYRAVILFYSQKFEESIVDFKMCNKIKKINRLLDNNQPTETSDDEFEDSYSVKSGKLSDLSSFEDNVLNEVSSEQTDLSDIGLCSINDNERLFNMCLCYIKMGNLAKALSITKKLK